MSSTSRRSMNDQKTIIDDLRGIVVDEDIVIPDDLGLLEQDGEEGEGEDFQEEEEDLEKN